MLKGLEKRVFMREAPKQVRYLRPLDYTGAEGLTRQAFVQMARDFQMVPPLTLHMSSPELMTGVWAFVRETLIAGPLSRARREAIATAVSATNQCPFCVDVHASMLHATGDHTLAVALRERGTGDSPDVTWAKATRSPGDPSLADPPFGPDEAPQLIGTAIGFHYINRMVNVFLPDSPLPMPKFMRRAGARLFGGAFGGKMVSVRTERGEFLTQEPSETLKPEFAWARSDPHVSGALRRFATEAEAAGARSVPEDARRAVVQFLERWHGEDPPLSNDWVLQAITEARDPGSEVVAQLALLTAVASYRIDDALASSVLKKQGERGLVEVAAWGAYRAALRISSWQPAL